ncbi:MAG: hypothetical protein US40_C0011G0005 [Candidatus Roizmanbacteria bacterium GW2011_GWC2_37_13]|uniref:Antitoxin n=1 Tax=Candidatus Roizmanbacteria bacterium GW2011_GWC2_37_13 TaxID=1618486 RepID=A0A0G0GGE2_9BACT|nr:MAG: hypothetical protein US38_C0007G0005 [Candidatus Roizmanbacteria bacterium GW2011_GWC1_37_12]KKQ25120.1 MAG: hypothetical protein US40_C0011G0005 [Candidatus Roizmanbacteria bacterium GW2011_GWC2_37_13]
MITLNNISTISDLRFKTKKVINKANTSPVFLFNRSTPTSVIISFEKYQEMTDTLEDYYLSLKAEDYEKENKDKVKWISHKEIKKHV